MSDKMTTDLELYKHGFNGLLKTQKEMWMIDYQSEVGTIIPQFSTFQFCGFSFIHEYNPRFSFQTSLEIILGSSDEGGSVLTGEQTLKWIPFNVLQRATIIEIIGLSNNYQSMIQLVCVHIFFQL